MSAPISSKPVEITLTRVFDAPRELVFNAWTDPKQLAKWWGPKGFTNPVCEIDARPGGKLLIHMAGPDGTVYPMTGVLREVAAPERLVFSDAAEDMDGNTLLEGVVTVLFEEQGGKTKVTVQASAWAIAPAAVEMLKGMNAGWSQSLDRLGELLAKA